LAQVAAMASSLDRPPLPLAGRRASGTSTSNDRVQPPPATGSLLLCGDGVSGRCCSSTAAAAPGSSRALKVNLSGPAMTMSAGRRCSSIRSSSASELEKTAALPRTAALLLGRARLPLGGPLLLLLLLLLARALRAGSAPSDK
jgi:hypothetical protein